MPSCPPEHPPLARTAATATTRRLLALCGALLSVACSEEPAGTQASPAPPSAAPPQEEPEESVAARLEGLRDLGYVDFSPEVADASEASGVTLWERDRVLPGYNLYCSRSVPEAYLMDLSGRIVHRWVYVERRAGTWSHVVLQDDGSLVVLVKFRYLMKLDRHSNLVWRREHKIHHEVSPDGDGFLVMLREFHEHRGARVAFPAIGWMDGEGHELRRWSAFAHLDELRASLDPRDFLDTMLDTLEAEGKPAPVSATEGRPYHYFHGNTVSRLPDSELGRSDPRFRAGNLLVCFRNVNQVFVLDAEDLRVTWRWGAGELDWPHHPTLVEDGGHGTRILVFDNGHERGWTRVLEVDPRTDEVLWSYEGSPPESFFSMTKGSAQRLANGNTLICEADAGRAREVTRAGEIVWAWNNPELSNGHRGAVYRMTRVTPEQARALLPPR